MFTSRSFPHQPRVECGGTPDAHGAREIIGDAILHLEHLEGTDLDRSRPYAMMTFTISQFGSSRLADIRQRAALPGTPFGARRGDACAHGNHIAQGSDLREKSSRCDARDYRGIPAFAVEVDATSPIGLGDRLQSWKIGAGPDAGRRTP